MPATSVQRKTYLEKGNCARRFFRSVRVDQAVGSDYADTTEDADLRRIRLEVLAQELVNGRQMLRRKAQVGLLFFA